LALRAKRPRLRPLLPPPLPPDRARPPLLLPPIVEAVAKAKVARAREGATVAAVADATSSKAVTSSKAAVSADVRLLSRPVPGFATILGPAHGPPRAASGLPSTAPTAGTHRLCAVTVFRRRLRSRWLEHCRPDRCPQPAGGAGVFSLGNGQRSDIPHVLQQRYTSLPSPVTTIFHYCW
jgi:hypothetical protein